MIYPYRCDPCEAIFDVVKKLADFDRVEVCPKCGTTAQRTIAAAHVHSSAGDWNRVSYNPALGCWTTSDKHAAQIAKSRGYEEIGNESPETVHKHFERQREETKSRRWAEADRVKLYGDD